jgi:hypothetical protein
MPIFRVAVNRKNCRVLVEDAVEVLGFYTYRFVEASNVEEAKKRAGAIVRKDLEDRIRNDPRDLPLIEFEEVVEVERKEKQPGFVWYQP